MSPKTVVPSDIGQDPTNDWRLKRFRRVLIGVLVTLAVLLLISFVLLLRAFQPPGQVASTREAAGVTWVRSIYGWGNTRTEQLGSPQSVAIGPDGLIWVTDAAMSRVISFRPDGTFNSMLDTGTRGAPGALSFPSSVAVDEQGLVYIGDMTASEVVVMSSDKKVVRRIQVPRPQSVAVRGDRLVVGAIPGFVIMTKAGEVVKVLGSKGTGDDQFTGVEGVAIAGDGTIYIVDQYNNRVSAYDTNGTRKWIRVMGKAGNQTTPQASMQSTIAADALQLPSGIAIDGSGRLVVVDAFGFNLAVLDPANGNPIASYGDAGTQDGTFVYPSGIAYDPARDWFAVADTSMDRVQLIRLPDTGGSVFSGVNRSLLGPARACLIPLALLFLVLVGGFIYNRIRRRRQLDPGLEGELAPEGAKVDEDADVPGDGSATP
jgi:sugar lactone lactonase YvrE